VSLEKVAGIEVLYNFGLYTFLPPRAVTMGCYNVLTITYFNLLSRNENYASQMYLMIA